MHIEARDSIEGRCGSLTRGKTTSSVLAEGPKRSKLALCSGKV
jgi:hypothetical protein